MAAKNKEETIAYIFQWKIENVSQCWWVERLQGIASPTFIIDGEESSKWSLWLYLKGCKEGDILEDEIVVKLHRESDCSGPENVVVKYQLTFLDKNGSILNEEINVGYFIAGQTSISQFLEGQENVFVKDREKFLPEDTLTVQCTLRKIKKESDREDLVKSENLYTRTVFKVVRKSFDWRIDKFSTLELEARKKFKNDLIEFYLVFNGDAEKTLEMEMISFHDCVKYLSFGITIVDSEGQKKSCGIKRLFDGHFKKGARSSIMIFPTQFFENKRSYLPNGILPLEFAFVLSTIKHYDCMKYSANVDGQEKHENMVVLAENFRSIYIGRLFSDIILRTNEHTFPAHKAILSARSPVFSRRLSNKMLERNSGYLDVDDLDCDTVHRMLLFLYSGRLENLELEDASKLYMAADKYEILTLKSCCSSFLKKNLCPENACHVLTLADQHRDNDLKITVEDYILDNDEVFKSLEWKPFMDKNLELAADILYKKLNRD